MYGSQARDEFIGSPEYGPMFGYMGSIAAITLTGATCVITKMY